MLQTLEGIKLLINVNRKDNKTVTCLDVDETEEMDPLLLSNHSNRFFYTITRKSINL